jgi:hypothetical protein
MLAQALAVQTGEKVLRLEGKLSEEERARGWRARLPFALPPALMPADAARAATALPLTAPAPPCSVHRRAAQHQPAAAVAGEQQPGAAARGGAQDVCQGACAAAGPPGQQGEHPAAGGRLLLVMLMILMPGRLCAYPGAAPLPLPSSTSSCLPVAPRPAVAPGPTADPPCAPAPAAACRRSTRAARTTRPSSRRRARRPPPQARGRTTPGAGGRWACATERPAAVHETACLAARAGRSG